MPPNSTRRVTIPKDERACYLVLYYNISTSVNNTEGLRIWRHFNLCNKGQSSLFQRNEDRSVAWRYSFTHS